MRVRLVEAIPTAGALRFEMLSDGKRACAGAPARTGAEITDDPRGRMQAPMNG